MDAQAWYLRTSKLAVALAIIHSKPADKSSREYTEHLARVVSGEESKWRSKVQDLEAEVLHLRQKLIVNKIYSASCKNENPTSQDPRSSENNSTLLGDSGCDLSNEHGTEPSEPSQHSMECNLQTPFPPLPIMKRHSATPKDLLSSHMQFLQHLLQLKKLTESGTLETDLTQFENDYSTVSDSVLQFLDGLITFYSNPRIPLSSFWTEAVSTIAKLFSDYNLSTRILKKCMKKLEEFEKTLLQVILRNNHINRFQVQHYVSQSLITLGSCGLLRRSIVSLLLSEVNRFTENLETISKEQSSYDAMRYENIFYLLWILEWLLQKETKEGNISSMRDEDQEIQRFLKKHDETIFQLADAFPLFTFYFWRLGILLNSAEKERVSNSSFP